MSSLSRGPIAPAAQETSFSKWLDASKDEVPADTVLVLVRGKKDAGKKDADPDVIVPKGTLGTHSAKVLDAEDLAKYNGEMRNSLGNLKYSLIEHYGRTTGNVIFEQLFAAKAENHDPIYPAEIRLARLIGDTIEKLPKEAKGAEEAGGEEAREAEAMQDIEAYLAIHPLDSTRNLTPDQIDEMAKTPIVEVSSINAVFSKLSLTERIHTVCATIGLRVQEVSLRSQPSAHVAAAQAMHEGVYHNKEQSIRNQSGIDRVDFGYSRTDKTQPSTGVAIDVAHLHTHQSFTLPAVDSPPQEKTAALAQGWPVGIDINAMDKKDFNQWLNLQINNQEYENLWNCTPGLISSSNYSRASQIQMAVKTALSTEHMKSNLFTKHPWTESKLRTAAAYVAKRTSSYKVINDSLLEGEICPYDMLQVRISKEATLAETGFTSDKDL